MGANPGENLVLFISYISLIGLAGFIVVIVRINIIDYVNNKRSRGTQDKDNDNPTI